MKIPEMQLEGTTEEIAEQLFRKIIAPMFEEINQVNPALAINFGFCIAGNAIGCYLSSGTNVDRAEKKISVITRNMALDVKRHKSKVC